MAIVGETIRGIEVSTDSAFRTQVSQPSSEAKPLKGAEATSGNEVQGIEVPFLDYENETGKPYLVDHFKLGDRWNDLEGGFPKEIANITSYIENKIDTGEVANSVTAIKQLLKGMEKVTNMSKEERAVVKIEVLSNYVEFLMKNDELKHNLRRYANTK